MGPPSASPILGALSRCCHSFFTFLLDLYSSSAVSPLPAPQVLLSSPGLTRCPRFPLPARPSSLVTFLSPSTSELLAYHTESLPAGSAILPFLKLFPSLPSAPWSPLLAQEPGDPPAPCLVPAVPCGPHHIAPFLGLPPDRLPPFAQPPVPSLPGPLHPGRAAVCLLRSSRIPTQSWNCLQSWRSAPLVLTH